MLNTVDAIKMHLYNLQAMLDAKIVKLHKTKSSFHKSIVQYEIRTIEREMDIFREKLKEWENR